MEDPSFHFCTKNIFTNAPINILYLYTVTAHSLSSIKEIVTLYKSLIQPYFDTCDKILKDKLKILQNHGARVITGARYDDRIRSSDFLEGLGWDNLHVR
jgi:hypothetical protein